MTKQKKIMGDAYDSNLLKNIEILSKIRIQDDKKNAILQHIKSSSKWFATISSIDISKINLKQEPLKQFNNPTNKIREKILLNKRVEHGYFIAPKVMR